jgi:hypothetical protein
VLTVAGSALAVRLLNGSGYVRKYVPPATGKLVQQLSLLKPQSESPAPDPAQLGIATVQPPLVQNGVVAGHATEAPHWPFALQVSMPPPAQSIV